MTTPAPERLVRNAGPTRRFVARWASWPTVVLLAAVVTWTLLILRNLPCRTRLGGEAPDNFALMCYSDIWPLYSARGLRDGNTPYFDTGDYQVLEYPVGTGFLLELERLLARIFAPQGRDLSPADQVASSQAFFDVNIVVLFCLFLVTVLAHLKLAEDRPGLVLMLAASPCVLLTGVINWDFLAVALLSLAILAWSRERPWLAGILIGLGTAAKLYPVLLLGPLLVLCLRAGRLGHFARTLVGAGAAWVVVNAPVYLFAREQWLSFWTFNSDRGADLGSIWYALSLAGVEVANLNEVSTLALLGMCAAVGAIILIAPRRPRLGQVAFLVVVAFLLTSKVYSPQYVLWLVPLLLLARPRWREWIVFTIAECIYFGAIWLHLGGHLNPSGGGPDTLYILAVLIRVVVQLGLAGLVVRDIFWPHHDPLRSPLVDDPHGGVLNHVPDARWHRRLFPVEPAGPVDEPVADPTGRGERLE